VLEEGQKIDCVVQTNICCFMFVFVFAGNMICDAIGLVKIPDQHAGQYPTAAAYIEWYFERFYHAEYIIDLIWKVNKKTAFCLLFVDVCLFV
jgi:hypothetical protein